MKLPFGKSKKGDRDQMNETDGREEASTFSQKIGQFFSTEPQKEKVLQHEDFNAAGDVYYANVSAAYKVAQRILWLFFVFFMTISITLNYQHITYDNFFHLIKDMSGAAQEGDSQYETLSYESDARQNFVLYRGGVATVSPSKLSIFTATGRRTLNATSSYSSPYVISSNKYVLVYDTSGTTFSLYNSFSRVHTETLDYPITNASLGADGSFVIVTRTADSRAMIYIYNKSFKRAAEISGDYYVFDIVLNTEQKQLALLTYDVGDGAGCTTLSVYDCSKMESQKEITKANTIRYNGEFPLSCGFLENNTFAIVTDRCIRILDADYDILEESDDYSSGNLTGYSLNESGVAVSYTESSRNAVIAFDKSGNMIYNDFVTFAVSDIAVCEDYVFLQTEQGVTRIHAPKGTEERLTSGQGKLLIYNSNTALICGESKAEYLIFKNP